MFGSASEERDEIRVQGVEVAVEEALRGIGDGTVEMADGEGGEARAVHGARLE